MDYLRLKKTNITLIIIGVIFIIVFICRISLFNGRLLLTEANNQLFLIILLSLFILGMLLVITLRLMAKTKNNMPSLLMPINLIFFDIIVLIMNILFIS